jgi:hypothetical protein
MWVVHSLFALVVLSMLLSMVSSPGAGGRK